MNLRLNKGADLHESLHSFQEDWRSGMENLEAKLAQKLAGLAPKPLFDFFLDMWKSYDLLYRGRCL